MYLILVCVGITIIHKLSLLSRFSLLQKKNKTKSLVVFKIDGLVSLFFENQYTTYITLDFLQFLQALHHFETYPSYI